MARIKYTKEEIKQKRKEQKQKAALRCYRCRGLKNFFIWLTGLISAFVLLITGVFVGLKFVPLNTYFGDTGELLSEDVASKSIIDAIMNVDKYDMSDFPIVAEALDSLVNSTEIGQFVEIDVDKIKTLKFDETFGAEIQTCIKVVATLDSVGATELLGDFAKLDIFSEWEEVDAGSMPIVNGNVIEKNDSGEFLSNPKLYYYIQSSNGGTMSSSGQFVRAFDDNGQYVAGYNGQQLYFANLAQVPVLDTLDLLDESIGRLQLTNIIGSFGGGSGFEDSFLGGILEGKNISDLENFTGEDILLSSILGEYNADTQLMYDILCSIVIADEKPTYETLSLAHLMNGIAFEGVLISTFIQGDTLDLLSSIIVDEQGNSIPAEEINVGHLTNGFELSNLKLEGFLDEDTVELLCSIITDKDGNAIKPEDLSVSHLTNGLDISNLKLDGFLDEDTVELLCSIITDKDGNAIKPEDLSVSHLTNGLDINNLKLEGFLEGNDEILELLSSMIVDGEGNTIDPSEITVGHLSGDLNLDNVKLEGFLDGNDEILELLCSIIVDGNGNPISVSDLTLAHLSGDINLSNLKIEEFLNDEMVELLCSILTDENGDPISASDLTVGHLSGEIEIENLKLEGFLDAEMIELLCSILVDENGDPISASDLTVGHLNGEIDIDSFAKEFSLEQFLGSYTENKDMYDLLHSAIAWEEGTVPPTADKMTVGDLSNGINFNNVSLEQFLGNYESNKEMYDILHSVIVWEEGTVPPTADKLTVGDLANGIDFDRYDFDSLSLEQFLGSYSSNKETYDLLHSAILWPEGVVPPTADKMTIGDLSNGVDFNNLLLADFLGSYEDNKEMYDILHSVIIWEEGTVPPTADKLTVGHLANGIDFDRYDFDSISLSRFLGDYNSNKEMYDLLHSVIIWEEGTVPPTADKLTVGDLSNGIDFDNLLLQNFLGDYNSNKETYDLLHSIIVWGEGTVPPTADKLTVGDLSNGIDFDNLSLQNFLGNYNSNQKTYDLLHSIIDWEEGATIPTADKLTVGDLSNGINFDNLSLQQVLGSYNDNKLTYDVLCAAVGMGNGEMNYSKLTLAHLKGDVNFNAVPLSVLGLDDSTVNMLLKAVNASIKATEGSPITKDELTITHLKANVFTYIALTDVLPIDGNSQLYSILLQASGVTLTNPSDKNEIAQKAQEITIHSLSSFNMNTVNLSTIVAIEGNEGLYNILSDATGKDANQITVADFASFDATKIHLSTVISSSDNIMLDKLINSGTTIGNLANAIDQLSLYDIYGQNCFVERKAGSTAPAYRYDASQKAYVLDEQGTYEISKSSGIWLLLCFDFDSEDIERENANSIGCARKYTISSATLSALKNGEEGLNITNKITKATIRQLVDAGVLPSANSAIYTLTLESLATWDGFDILGGINA